MGGSTMAVIASQCPDITVNVVDHDLARITEWSRGEPPLFEPGLREVVASSLNRNLHFLVDLDYCIASADIIFVAVNTPSKEYGKDAGRAIDLIFVESVARTIAKSATGEKIIVEMSSVPVRTADTIATILRHNAFGLKFQMVSNPVFLSRGTAIRDLISPDRILLGGESTPEGQRAVETIAQIYARWLGRDLIITMGLWSAELSKLVANAFLAQRVSSMNTIASLCEIAGVDVDLVSEVLGSDSRIGGKYLKPSVGFGGPCLRKDILNLVYLCEALRLPEVAAYWEQVSLANDCQKHRFSKRIIIELSPTVVGKKIAVLGFSFKKNTNDTRNSAAVTICQDLLEEKAHLAIYDPAVSKDQIYNELTRPDGLPQMLEITSSAQEACAGADAIAVFTDWDEFLSLDYSNIFSKMAKPARLFDGRGCLDLCALSRIGFRTFGVGKPPEDSKR